ncbi:YtxH domain-containing protein [Chlamydiifrater phoenicopteri]|uniref:YtxH domain-containing protein n=1 Tax=Chlamydiifrater phoenicopteri TaxID=2681469 RepID=UPI001BCABBE3|nr:YtxH domain-containing protein [Chlamydiifrater phoenicopteri]
MFTRKPIKCKKKTTKHFKWLRGALFGGFVATIITLLFAPKSGKQTRRRFNRIRSSSQTQGKTLIKNSKNHARIFANHAKTLAKNLSKEIKAFAKSLANSDQ